MNYVYLIGNKSVGVYKIGATKSVEKRLKTNQTSCPYVLETICSFPSEYAYKIERLLHKDFNQFKKDENDNDIRGEWFVFSQQQIDVFLTKCQSYHNNFQYLKDANNPFFHKELKK